MTREEIKTIILVYNKLMEREKNVWDDLDDYLEMLEWMTDDEIYRECDIIYSKHKDEEVGCDVNHPKEKCFVPILLEACESILSLYLEKNELHPKNRYILQYYLALTHANFIQIKSKS